MQSKARQSLLLTLKTKLKANRLSRNVKEVDERSELLSSWRSWLCENDEKYPFASASVAKNKRKKNLCCASSEHLNTTSFSTRQAKSLVAALTFVQTFPVCKKRESKRRLTALLKWK